MIIGRSEEGIVRQCRKCHTVYKGDSCPYCSLIEKNDYDWPEKLSEETYAQKQIRNTLEMCKEQEEAWGNV